MLEILTASAEQSGIPETAQSIARMSQLNTADSRPTKVASEYYGHSEGRVAYYRDSDGSDIHGRCLLCKIKKNRLIYDYFNFIKKKSFFVFFFRTKLLNHIVATRSNRSTVKFCLQNQENHLARKRAILTKTSVTAKNK